MAQTVSTTNIHRPGLPNLVIEHISRLEENGATCVLQALGFMKTGVDSVWYDRAHLTIVENQVERKLRLLNETRNLSRPMTPINFVEDVTPKGE